MKISQVSVFLENKPGRLSEPCKLLAEAGINIVTLSLADTQQFGILRILVRDWEKARTILERAGHVVKVTKVAAIELPDRPGGLYEVLKIIEQCGINVEYVYALTFRRENKVIMVFRFEDLDAAIKQLKDRGVNMIGSAEIYKRLED